MAKMESEYFWGMKKVISLFFPKWLFFLSCVVTFMAVSGLDQSKKLTSFSQKIVCGYVESNLSKSPTTNSDHLYKQLPVLILL
jgi:hypothetical protein